jgi:putative tryptophan/tyrosine transport system substrate-binding protein
VAQQPAMPVIGYLLAGGPEGYANSLAAFRKGLSETGYVEGRNVAIEPRFAQNEFDRLPALAADLVRRRVAVIATFTLPAALAAKAATTTIPIVFNIGLDPVQAGLAASLNQPGGNVTGVTTMSDVLWSKKLGLLHELLPGAVRFAMLVNPNSPLVAETTITEVQAAARTFGRQIEVLTASTNREIDMAFASLVQKRADALLVSPDTLFGSRRVQLVTLAARDRIPAIYRSRQFVEAGGLMSYGPNPSDQQREVGIYTGRILKGDKPADLPVMRATRFEFVINLQTARTLGIDIPATLLAIADEVIE